MKKKSVIITLLVLVGVIIFGGWWFYTPPFLNGSAYNLPARIYDFFAYAFYAGRAQWREEWGGEAAAARDRARAAWHNPSRAEDLLDLPAEDYFVLAREYAHLGLEQEAVQVFKDVLPGALADRKKALEIIAYLALLGDWPGVAAAASQLVLIYPDSGEAAYWLGRSLLETGSPGKASDHLEKVSGDAAFGLDARYQAARAAEQLNQTARALSLYEEVVAALPGHRGAWKALDRIYGAEGEPIRQKSAHRRWTALTPENPLKFYCRNRFILRGYSFSAPGDVSTGEEISLNLFLEGWESGPATVRLEIVLINRSRLRRISRPIDEISLPAAGEVAVYNYQWSLPLVVYPGRVDLNISLIDPVTGKPWRLKGAEFLPGGSVFLSPRWLSSPSRSDGIIENFGPHARALGKSTFLGPQSELELTLDRAELAAAVGLVSYSHTSGSLPQDSVLAELVVQTSEKEEIVFPIRVGRETSEVYWEGYPVSLRRHQQAPVFASWPVRSGGKEFYAHEYRAVLPLTEVRLVRSLRLKNLDRQSGIYVGDIVLIEDYVNAINETEE